MDTRNPVEIADRLSRKRAIIIAVAGVTFLIAQLLDSGPHIGQLALWCWAMVLLLLIATGGGLLHQSKVRALMNDDVSRAHHRTAVSAGFWTAMVAALAFYWVPGVDRRTVQMIATFGITAALLVFAYLELRA